MLFSPQEVYCNNCGRKFETKFAEYGGRVCGRNCFLEMNWKKTLSILGKKFEPMPDEMKKEK